MKKVRQSVFETNSSSIHAISVVRGNGRKNGLDVARLRQESGLGNTLYVKPGEFGWECEWYDDWEDRLRYLYTIACMDRGWEWDEWKSRIAEALKSVGFEPEFKAMKTAISSDGLHVYVDGAEDGSWFYIDHCEDIPGDLLVLLHDDQDFMLDFIFGDTVISTGNDNGDSCHPEVPDQVGALEFWKYN